MVVPQHNISQKKQIDIPQNIRKDLFITKFKEIVLP